MNRTLLMIALGIISSIILAFAVLYIISMMNIPKQPPSVGVMNIDNESKKVHYILLFNDVNFIPLTVQTSLQSSSSSTNYLYQFYNSYTENLRDISWLSKKGIVITTYPSLIIAQPNSTTWFVLIVITNTTPDNILIASLNVSLYNITSRELIYSNGNIYYYNITMRIYNVNADSILMIPVWDNNYGYTTYIEIFVI
ncbi:MAG: hypothetical protein OWQ54_08345 [Sulfolobaceae archaeon]|nr:hypothetical protein [Sulfolobaceae archaeon]